MKKIDFPLAVCNSRQWRAWDQFTIQKQAISSLDLMERASRAFVNYFIKKFPDKNLKIAILLGKGNNAGDGLAIGRLLHSQGYRQIVLLCSQRDPSMCSPDYQTNWYRLPKVEEIQIVYLENWSHDFSQLLNGAILIDALLGTGFNPPLSPSFIQWINLIDTIQWQSIVSVDIPSGLTVEPVQGEFLAISANHTFTFECLKKSFLFADSAKYTGQVHVIPIGLDREYHNGISTEDYLLDREYVRSLSKDIPLFAHKYHFGTALILAGSEEYPGASVLAAKGALAVGAGLVKSYCVHPNVRYYLAQCPEIIPIENINLDSFKHNTAILIGPGLGSGKDHWNSIALLQKSFTKLPFVIDADGLNIFREEKLEWPKLTIITPHEGEYRQLTKTTANSSKDLLDHVQAYSADQNIIVILKGKYTRIALPNGEVYFNTTGNTGLAKAGSGDILAGMITGLLCQGYSLKSAALVGVYLHGLSADMALEQKHIRSIGAKDIFKYLPYAMKSVLG